MYVFVSLLSSPLFEIRLWGSCSSAGWWRRFGEKLMWDTVVQLVVLDGLMDEYEYTHSERIIKYSYINNIIEKTESY